MNDPVLFIAKDGREVRPSDFAQALKDLGIQDGDQMFLHTRMFGFGKLNWRAKLTKAQIFDSVISGFQEVVGESGAVMMTTFSQAAHETGVYNVAKTPSEGGALTEYFRQQPGVERSEHPTHSFAIWGSDKDFYLAEAKSTFGLDSIYGKLYQRDAWLVDWGTGFRSTTYLHLVEAEANLPYRKESEQEIKVVTPTQTYLRKVFKYRKSSRYSVDYRAFEKDLMAKGLLKRVPVGDGEIIAIRAKIVMEEGLKTLKKDPYSFVSVESFFPWFKRQVKIFLKSKLKKG